MILENKLLHNKLIDAYGSKVLNDIFYEIGDIVINKMTCVGDLIVRVTADKEVKVSQYYNDHGPILLKGDMLIAVVNHCNVYKIHKGVTHGFLEIKLTIIAGICRGTVSTFALASQCQLIDGDYIQCDAKGVLSTNSMDGSIKHSKDRMIEASLCLVSPKEINNGKYVEKLAVKVVNINDIHLIEYVNAAADKIIRSFGSMVDNDN